MREASPTFLTLMSNQTDEDHAKRDSKRRHHLRMRQELVESNEKQRTLQRQLAVLSAEYRKTRELLKRSQLANSMLRRLFSQEREQKFHMWLRLLEHTQPGRLYSILRASYRYLDSMTHTTQSRLHRAGITVENCSVVRICHRGNESALGLEM